MTVLTSMAIFQVFVIEFRQRAATKTFRSWRESKEFKSFEYCREMSIGVMTRQSLGSDRDVKVCHSIKGLCRESWPRSLPLGRWLGVSRSSICPWISHRIPLPTSTYTSEVDTRFAHLKRNRTGRSRLSVAHDAVSCFGLSCHISSICM